MREGDNADRVAARVRERFAGQRRVLTTHEGISLRCTKSIAEAWLRVNEMMMMGSLWEPRGLRLGNRYLVPRVVVEVCQWKDPIPLEFFGYKTGLRLARLRRNYWNEESIQKAKDYFAQRNPEKHSSHGVYFGTGKKKTPPCLTGGTFNYFPGYLNVDFYIRSSEVTKTLGADLVFLDQVIREVTPKWMRMKMSVRIHLNMAFVMAQWFPLFDMIAPGKILYPEKYRFDRMCLQSIKLARNVDGYTSKWKPEKRLHNFYRREMSKYRADKQGRIVEGPSFFPFKAR